MIDAYEDRYTAIADVPGAYLHAEMPQDKLVSLKLKGQFADIMCKVNPEYKQYLRYEGKTKVFLSKGTKSNIRMPRIGFAMVQPILFNSTEDGFYSEPVRSLRSQQDSEQITMHSGFLRGRQQNIPRRLRSSESRFM